MLITVIGIILIFISIIILYKGINLKVEKTQQINTIKQQIKLLNEDCQKKYNKLQSLKQESEKEENKINVLKQQQNKVRQEIDSEVSSKRIHIDKLFSDLKTRSSEAYSFFEKTLDSAYLKKEKEFQQKIEQINMRREQAQSELNQVKDILQAAAAASVRQKELEQNFSFYQIQITDKQISDIQLLQNWKHKLYEPSIVSKIIWSTYILKPTSAMCNRVLGTSQVCGIYKITDKITNQAYIGQSKNISDRWKAHAKCGLGINASPSNKLYNAMQEHGVYNFTFEVLETCSPDKLNEKERFWIEMYQSDNLGMNSTKGNK